MISPLLQATLVCPRCKQQLEFEERQGVCSACGRCFPIIVDGIIALFEVPERVLAKAYLRLKRIARQWRSTREHLADSLRTSSRANALAPIVAALDHNSAFFACCASELEPYVAPAELAELNVDKLPLSYGYDFHYLDRDWTNQESGNSQIERKLKEIRRCLSVTDRRGSACVLGMGSGRLGLELAAYFRDLWGVDSAYGQIAQYHALLKDDVSFWKINTSNQLNQATFVQERVASIPGRLVGHLPKVTYVWADAFNSPFANERFDWVFSVYFSDVRPLPELIAEARRILKPGGFLLHYGPLQYHFDDLEHHYGYDEFKTLFVDHDFEIIHEATSLPITTMDVASTLHIDRQFIDKVLLLRFLGLEDSPGKD